MRGQGLATAELITGTPVDKERYKLFLREIAEELRTGSPADMTASEEVARNRAPEIWDALPVEVSSLLTQAEYLASLSHPPDFDWSPAVVQYCRAIESFLCDTVGRVFDRYHGAPDRPRIQGVNARASGTTLGEFAHALSVASQDKRLWQHLRTSFPGQEGNLRAIAGEVVQINRIYRQRSVHGSDSSSLATVRRLSSRIFDSAPKRRSLLHRLVDLSQLEAPS